MHSRNEGPPTPAADPPLAFNSPGHAVRQAVRGCLEADFFAQLRRLGQVLLFSPHVDRQLAFYTILSSAEAQSSHFV